MVNLFRVNLHFTGQGYAPDRWRRAAGRDPLDALQNLPAFWELRPARVAVQLGRDCWPNGAPVVCRELTLEYTEGA